MSLPRVLKDFDVSQDGSNWIGKMNSVTLPKWTRKTEDIIVNGLAGPATIDLGQEKPELSFSAGGYLREALNAYGATTVDAVGIRFNGAYQDDSVGTYDAVEIYARGRYTEIDPGEAKGQTVGEWKYTMPLANYRLTINGKVVIEYDLLGNRMVVNGIDINAAKRAALGRW